MNERPPETQTPLQAGAEVLAWVLVVIFGGGIALVYLLVMLTGRA